MVSLAAFFYVCPVVPIRCGVKRGRGAVISSIAKRAKASITFHGGKISVFVVAV
jgi:hypothetical protein